MGSKTRQTRHAVAVTKTTLESPLLDSDAVALALGVTRRHVQRLVAERRIPFLKIGRFVRFDPAELNVWLDQQRVESVRATFRECTPWR
jgi:excisionase family DNA binding protein